MPRVKGGTTARARRKKYLDAAKGYFGSKHRLFKTAKEQVQHSLVYAYRDRRQTKRNLRKLWIVRINAGCRENEISYSKFINGLKIAGIDMNRKMLSELAIAEPTTFAGLVKTAKEALLDPTAAIAKKAEVKVVSKPVVKKETVKKEVVSETTEKATAKKTVAKAEAKKTPVKKETTEKAPAKKAATKKTK